MKTAAFYEQGIEKLFYIVDDHMQSVPFNLKALQKRVLSQLSTRDMILKARQEGISSMVEAIFAIDFLTIENIRCVVISHEQKATQRLFDKVKYYLDSMKKTWPKEAGEPYRLKYNSKTEIVNLAKNSTYYIGTAGARAFGRGDTINNLHISELPQWPDQEQTMAGLLQAVPQDGRIIIEATANGLGDYFYKLWTKNKDNPQPWKTHFIPWFEDPKYIMPANNVDTLIDGHPTYGDEVKITNQYHLTKEQMAWRRWKIDEFNGNMDMFNQEFPATAEEAFIVSGNPVWSPTLMKWYLLQTKKEQWRGNLIGYDPIGLEQNDKGNLKIWRKPEEFHNYCIGVDVSEGKVVTEMEGGKERDKSCVQVLDKTTYEQAAVWHGQKDPDVLGREVEKLARYYNNAFVAVERNNIGLTTLITLRDLNYSNMYYREKLGLITEKQTAELGWVTDMRTKEMLVNETTNLIRDKRMTIYDEDTIGEMMSYVRDSSGHANAARSAFDDRVMALMIAVMMLTKRSAGTAINPIEQGDSNLFTQGGFVMDGVTFNQQGMPTDPDSMDI